MHGSYGINRNQDTGSGDVNRKLDPVAGSKAYLKAFSDPDRGHVHPEDILI
jgi:hypothetical protein